MTPEQHQEHARRVDMQRAGVDENELIAQKIGKLMEVVVRANLRGHQISVRYSGNIDQLTVQDWGKQLDEEYATLMTAYVDRSSRRSNLMKVIEATISQLEGISESKPSKDKPL